uniref:Uncharacterized protein n=1 Tax=Arundo donax TaxID=35708 RepID=A0A0A9AA19_ARUDO
MTQSIPVIQSTTKHFISGIPSNNQVSSQLHCNIQMANVFSTMIKTILPSSRISDIMNSLTNLPNSIRNQL